MTTVSYQAQREVDPVPAQLHERVSQLGLTLVSLFPDGRAVLHEGGRWTDRLLVKGPIFQAQVRRQWEALAEGAGGLVSLWPGMRLLPLESSDWAREPERVDAVLMPGPALVESEQMRAICEYHRLDYEAAVKRITKEELMGDREAERTAAMLGWMHRDTKELDRHCEVLEDMSRQLATSYEELCLLYEVASNATVDQPPQSVLAGACRELQHVSALSWTALLVMEDGSHRDEMPGAFFCAGLSEAQREPVRELSQALMEQAQGATGAWVVDDVATAGLASWRSVTRSLLVVPLRSGQRLLGLLVGGDREDAGPISTSEIKLSQSLVNNLAIFLDNTMLYGDMQSMFMGTLHALTSAIDAKDSYTHGHSERVALLSRQLAEAAGLDEHTCERVYVAGLVHDVGKIGVPESVLSKPGDLSPDEFEMIKAHPEIGARILADIEQMQDLVSGVLCHHERWDGGGYPHGLRGMEIPLFGRLIGLADAFDAMCSDRTYRYALDLEEAIGEIARCRGQQFDPELSELFTGLDFSPYRELIQKHQQEHGV